MGFYSREPPRKDLHLHHTYDAIEPELDRVLDIGPQGNDGSIVGTVETGVAGIDGNGVRVEEGTNDYVNINDLVGTIPRITISSWIKFEHEVPTATDNVSYTLELNSSDETLQWEFPEAFTGWHYFAATYDRNEMKLWHGTETSEPLVVAKKSASGDITNDFSLKVDVKFSAIIDETRVYTTDLSASQIEDVWAIAAEHGLKEEVADAWQHAGLPFISGQGNERLGSTLVESSARAFRSLDSVLEARHIDEAAGPQLDRIGKFVGVKRKDGEQDDPYRARIKATFIAGRSSGTFDDLLTGIASILGVDDLTRIDLDRLDADIAVAEITIRTADLNDANITKSDLATAAEDMVPAGHAISIVETSEFAFTVIEDGDTNDPQLGLTSDSTSDGGELVSDA